MKSSQDPGSGKQRLRGLLREQRTQHDSQQWSAVSAKICQVLISLPELQHENRIGAYLSDSNEVDLRPYLQQCLAMGKEVYLPRFQSKEGIYQMVRIRDVEQETVIGKYRICEPLPELPAADRNFCNQHLCYLVPGMAFDVSGRRLGRGKGYYDRLLTGGQKLRIGICPDWTLLEEVPAEDHDIKMDMVITDLRIFRNEPRKQE